MAPEEPPELLLCKNLALSGKEAPEGAKPGENARPQLLATTAPAVLKEVKHIPLRKGIGRRKLRAPLWIMAGLPMLQGDRAVLLLSRMAGLLRARVAADWHKPDN